MAYHFIYPLPTIPGQPLRDPKAQAKLHADWAGSDILAACDLEWPEPEKWAKWGCTAKQIVAWAVIYLEEYERLTGIRPIVYTYPYFADAIKLPASFAEKYKLWIASYTNTPRIPKPWTSWVIWQDSGGKTTNLPGGGPVDTNKARDLSLWEEFENRSVDVSPPPPLDPTPPPVPNPTPPPEPLPVVPVVPTPVPVPVKPTIWQFLIGLFNKILKKQ
jgi:GH25 family lysozyme M1 (1,4-beta-N-acetylmuramidase)